MAKAKRWSQLTDNEINSIKKTYCMNCYYAHGYGLAVSNFTCGYIETTGHRRGCWPGECKEKGIYKPCSKGTASRRQKYNDESSKRRNRIKSV